MNVAPINDIVFAVKLRDLLLLHSFNLAKWIFHQINFDFFLVLSPRWLLHFPPVVQLRLHLRWEVADELLFELLHGYNTVRSFRVFDGTLVF